MAHWKESCTSGRRSKEPEAYALHFQRLLMWACRVATQFDTPCIGNDARNDRSDGPSESRDGHPARSPDCPPLWGTPVATPEFAGAGVGSETRSSGPHPFPLTHPERGIAPHSRNIASGLGHKRIERNKRPLCLIIGFTTPNYPSTPWNPTGMGSILQMIRHWQIPSQIMACYRVMSASKCVGVHATGCGRSGL